jgi:uncharacterized protein YkwD
MTNEGVFRRHFGALCCALAMAGCAGLSANKRSPAQVTDGQFKPTLPPEPAYGQDAKLTCPAGGPNGAIEDLLKKDEKGKKLVADGRLCAVAETLLGWTPPGENAPVPDTLRAFVSQYFGLPGTIQSNRIIAQDLELTNPAPADIAQPMTSPLLNFAESATNPHYGLIVDRYASQSTGRAGTGTTTVKYHVRMVMFDDVVVLDPPLPRALPQGGNATVSGHVEGSYKNLKLQVVDPVGKLTTTPLEGQHFSAPIACGDRPGRMLVQIGGEGESGDVRIATLPIECGGQTATQVALVTAPTGPVDPAQAEKQIAENINQQRTAAGLKALNVNAPLSDIARTMSERQVAGKPLSGGDLSSMIKEKEISAPSINASGAMAFSADEAAAKLSDNPSDRATQMSPESTDLGIGVAKGNEVGGKPTIMVSVLYVKTLPPADPVAVKAKLYEAIAKKRSDGNLEPLQKDETLEGVAQKYADAAAQVPTGQVPRDQESDIFAPLYKHAMVVNQLGGWMPDEVNAMQFAEQPAIVGKNKLVGVGVALGKSDRFGKNSLFVMVLVGSHTAPAKAPAKKSTKKK